MARDIDPLGCPVPSRHFTSWLAVADGRTGGARRVGDDRRVKLLSPSVSDAYAENPAGVGVTLWYERPAVDDTAWEGRLEVVGVLEWSTGGGHAEAEFDITVHGTQVQLCGGADGVSLSAYATGDAQHPVSGEQLFVALNGLLSVNGSGRICPRRTTVHVMDGDEDLILPIPTFAHRVYLMSTSTENVFDWDGIGARARIVFYADPGGVNVVGQEQWPSAGGVVSIPIGAAFYGWERMAGGDAWVDSRVSAIWELAL